MPKKRARSPTASLPTARGASKLRSADTPSPRDVKAQERTTALLAKWLAAHADGTLQMSVDAYNAKAHKRGWPHRDIEVITNASDILVAVIIDVACVACGERKRLLPSHFTVHNAERLLLSCRPGHESFCNSISHPCNACWSRICAAKNATIDGWLQNCLMLSYSSLRPPPDAGYDATPVGWYWWRWKEQGGDFSAADGVHVITRPARCANTGRPILMTGRGMKDAFSPSVNNTNMEISAPEDHVEASTELVCKETNMRQDTAMPSLAGAWFALLTAAVRVATLQTTEGGRTALAAERAAESDRVRVNFANRKNKRANGVTADQHQQKAVYKKQIYELDVFTISASAAERHRQQDVKRGRDARDNMTAVQMAARWIAQPWCALSGVLLTITNGPFRVSVDRLGQGVAHTVADTQLVCRILNGSPPWTRRTFVELLLTQTRVEVPPETRAALEAELALT